MSDRKSEKYGKPTSSRASVEMKKIFEAENKEEPIDESLALLQLDDDCIVKENKISKDDKYSDGTVNTSNIKTAGGRDNKLRTKIDEKLKNNELGGRGTGEPSIIDLQMEEFCRVRMNFNLVRQLIDEYIARNNAQLLNPTPGGPPVLETLEVLCAEGAPGTPQGSPITDPKLLQKSQNVIKASNSSYKNDYYDTKK